MDRAAAVVEASLTGMMVTEEATTTTLATPMGMTTTGLDIVL